MDSGCSVWLCFSDVVGFAEITDKKVSREELYKDDDSEADKS
jgi:hypothetical protein